MSRNTILISAWVFLSTSVQAGISLSLEHSGNYWRSINVTSHWSFDPALPSQTTPYLVFRYQSGRLLVGAAFGDPEKSPQYSSNRYVTDLQRGGLHTAKPAEWDASPPLGTHVDSPFRRPPAKQGQDVTYAGRTFRGRGEHLDSFALSPDGQWLAIMSWKGHIPGCGDVFCFDPSVPHGQFFIDIYNVATGTVKTRLSAGFLFEEPFEALKSARWISDRHFMIATSGAKRLVLCDMRPAERATAAAWDLVKPGAEILGFWEESRLSRFERVLDVLTLHTAIRSGTGGPYTLKGELFSSNDSFQRNRQFMLPPGYATSDPLLRLHEWTTLVGGSAFVLPGIHAIGVQGTPSAPGPYEFRSLQLTGSGLASAQSLGPTEENPLTSAMNYLAEQLENGRRSLNLAGKVPNPSYTQKAPGIKPPGVKWSLTGENRFELVDDDHDGRAEFLHIQIGVETNVSGCVLQGKLLSQNGSFEMSLAMRETETAGSFSAYVPGSELYFTFGNPQFYRIEDLQATCGETTSTSGWAAWEDHSIKLQSGPFDPQRFQTPYQLKARRLPRASADHVEFSLDCVPRAPLRFPLEFSDDSGFLPVRIEPSRGPCQPDAARVIVDNPDNPVLFDAVISVFAASPGSARAYRDSRAELHWIRLGTSPVVGVNPAKGEGPASQFWVKLQDWRGVAKLELLFNERPDPRGGCHISDVSDLDGGERRMILESDDGSEPNISYAIRPQRIENSRCSVEGNGLLSGFAITAHFKPTFFGPKKIYVRVIRPDEKPTDWEEVGTWIASALQPPQAISVTPYLGAGLRQTFTFSVFDPNGNSQIANVKFLIQRFRSRENACSFDLDRNLRGVTLTSDQPPAPAGVLHPGDKSSIANVQCRVSNLRLDSLSPDSLQVRVDIEFFAAFAGRRNIYVNVEDRAGLSSGSIWLGSWVVPAP
jgi:hypothetical protein